MQQFNDYEHLDLRSQFYARMSNEISRNPDAAYTFMNLVCNLISLSELPLLESYFKNAVKEKEQSRN